MRLHRHYKNKPYKVLGVAKHSETLEDLVVYETLYENETASLWVRPRPNFEGSVLVDGREEPRFAKIDLQIDTFTGVGHNEERVLSTLIKEIFGEWDPEWFHATLRNRPRIHLLMAAIDGRPVAFKLGYEMEKWCFYSWLGGVLPDVRGLGIAADLIAAQHDWCRNQGYHRVQTKTQNRWRTMLILNLKAGFEIVGFHASSDGGPKLMLEKRLLHR